MDGCDIHRARTILDYLVEEDYLAQINVGNFPVVEMGKRAGDFLRLKEPLVMMLPKETEKPVRAEPPQMSFAQGEAETPVSAASFDEGLFQKLKELRRRLAAETGVPAYIVFSDASLRDMCRKQPRTPGAFAEVAGVGEVKLERYGGVFIECIKKYFN
jgi:ATP-dependent DNA helicase RecQ